MKLAKQQQTTYPHILFTPEDVLYGHFTIYQWITLYTQG